MCRMLGCVGPLAQASALVASFRRAASDGKTLLEPDGHRDGWGIAYAGPDGAVAHAGRSAQDATRDPAYPEAARRVAGPGRGVALAHMRAASAGAVSAENAHPFVADGLAFCHNGTIHGLAPEGESDSRAYFGLVRDAVRAGAPPEEALLGVARALAKEPRRLSSLTCLMTDGRTLWGVRKVGEDPEECADAACAADYYTLGVARVGDLTVLAQEHGFAPAGAAFEPLPDGTLVAVAHDGTVRTRSL